jgi:hypothetical protein
MPVVASLFAIFTVTDCAHLSFPGHFLETFTRL